MKNRKLAAAFAVQSVFVIILGYLNMKDMDKSSLEEEISALYPEETQQH
jgi:hypothetical protein